ncbi:cytochrome P450 [Rhizophagus irregularis DAOM 181602=DAOM 197198]|uniref:Cytochrome P450 n=3 Tax=Rhizophagus irregularis TaxID=588596 RepID=A0A2P4PUC5_RHIID|nr:cytochrome P450 [Rhizophagus irregularis DAOM 181602=DAOM 197198]POG68950.1 cytochrome P450 [Rhizophagus irregularis DAOM 181602=DAOM 197198]|eukprot:XP_025175816.1 cytochrome P450 [Rhizophagus irregularis DAOM 181602=DAOM 197198]
MANIVWKRSLLCAFFSNAKIQSVISKRNIYIKEYFTNLICLSHQKMYQTIILGSILLISLYISKRIRETKLNMPPLARYKIPIIGHTYSYIFNSEEFIKQCKKEYGDIFSIYVWGRVRTIVGKEYAQEILSKDDTFSFFVAFRKRFPGDVLLKNLGAISPIKLLKEHVFPKLNFYSERMQKSLHPATQKYIDIDIGDHDEPKVFNNMYYLMARIISTPIANILIGEVNDEIITTFAEFTRDLSIFLIIPPFLDFIYPGLQNYVNRIVIKSGLYNPAIKHQDILIKHIKKQACKRLQEKEKYGDSWKRPDDFLQDIMEQDGFDSNNVDYSSLADRICSLLFAAIHTTTGGCANAFMDLASRPQYMQELYEEQLEVHKEADEDGILPFEALNKMKKLDSFIRESLRLTGHIVALEHAVLKDHTFLNGLQVPKDRLVYVYVDDVNQDESLQGPNPKSFEPFRHVDANALASKIGKNYMPFGGGKHACPGRYFAINEIKFFMHNVILKYNFRTASGKVEERRRVGPLALPSSGAIIIEKRVK